MNLIKRIVLTAGIALALTGCTSSQNVSSVTSDSTDKQSDIEVSKETPDINVVDIWNTYNEDPDKDTPNYDGDAVTATGVITYIGKDDHGTDSMELSDKQGGTSYVLGVFGSADEMSPVSVGDTVTITGNFHIMSSTNMVVIKQCKIDEIYK